MKARISNLTWALRLAILFLALVLLANQAPPRKAAAHAGATGVVKERMTLMASLGDAMKAMAAMFKKQIPYDGEVLARHAATISQGTDALTGLFPHGSNDKPSKALPAIWEDWPAFQQLTTELNTASARLAEIAPAAEPRQARRQFAQVARACSACHERFRIEP